MPTTHLIDLPTRTVRPQAEPRATPQPGNDAQVRLQQGVERLTSLVPGCHHASVTTVSGGRISVHAATDGAGRRAAELQDELDDGPSLQAVRTGHSVVARDLRTETRWARWCSAALDELQVTAALSVLLPSTLRPPATLNLCSHTAGGLSGLDIARLHALAAALSDALLDERLVPDQLGPAA